MQGDELWARSYAQYIATKSGSAALMRELNEVRNGTNDYRFAQWDDADFKPISAAMDVLFKGLGWLK